MSNGQTIDPALRQIHATPFVKLAQIFGVYETTMPSKEGNYCVFVVSNDAEANNIPYLGENKRVVLLDSIDEILGHPGCEISISRSALMLLFSQGQACISLLTHLIYSLQEEGQLDRRYWAQNLRSEAESHMNTETNLRAELHKAEAMIVALKLEREENEKALAAAQLLGGSEASKKRAKDLVEKCKRLEKRNGILDSENKALSALAGK